MSEEVVKKQFTATFHQELCFIMSVSNIIFSAWMLGAIPVYYWIFHLIKNTLYIFAKYKANVKKNWQYFLLDFCYTVNYWSFLYFLLCPLKKNVPYFHNLQYLNQFGPMLFRLAFTWSTGVLALSIGVFQNSMIFHSIEHMSILAVHIGPPIVVWSMRWYAADLQNTFPDTFHIGCLNSENCEATKFEILVIPAIAYIFLWTIPYSILIFIVKAKKINDSNYVTMFSYYEDKIFKPDKGWKDPKYLHLKQATYMSIHGILCFISFIIAYISWHSFVFHTLYLVILLHISIYNGATYYFRVLLNKDKIIKNYLEQHENDDKIKDLKNK